MDKMFSAIFKKAESILQSVGEIIRVLRLGV